MLMRRLLVILIVSSLLVCNTGCARDYKYSHEEYLESIAVIEEGDAGDTEEELCLDFNQYDFNQDDYPLVELACEPEFIGDEFFSVNSFEFVEGNVIFYLHSNVNLKDFKLQYENSEGCGEWSSPILLRGVTKVVAPADYNFRITGISGSEIVCEYKETNRAVKYGQSAFKIKKGGYYVFSVDSVIIKVVKCEKGCVVSVPSTVNNVLEVKIL